MLIADSGLPVRSLLHEGVGQPVCKEPESLADVRRTDPRSAEIDSPAGVTRCFQVSVYKVEPTEAVLARNLLAKDDARLALCNEVVPRWPEVPLVNKPSAFACRAERLARAGAGPNRSVIQPSGSAQGVGPDADPGEKMALCVGSKVIGGYVLNRAGVDVARRNVPGAMCPAAIRLRNHCAA